MTYKNQLTIPKAILTQVPQTEYFQVETRAGAIILRPAEVRAVQARSAPITHPRWPAQVEEVLQAFTKRVKQAYGRRLVHVIVYGSYARGAATADSDLDVAVVLQHMTQRWPEHERLHDIVYEVTYGSNRPCLLSVVPMDAQHYAAGETSLIRQIKAEGVTVA